MGYQLIVKHVRTNVVRKILKCVEEYIHHLAHAPTVGLQKFFIVVEQKIINVTNVIQ